VPRASRPLTAAERNWLHTQMGREVLDPGASALPAVEPRETSKMIGRPSAQAAVAPVTRLQATGQATVSSAASAAVPPAVPPVVASRAARVPATAGEIRARGRGDPRASPGGPPSKYRTVFACASHAEDTPSKEQCS